MNNCNSNLPKFEFSACAPATGFYMVAMLSVEESIYKGQEGFIFHLYQGLIKNDPKFSYIGLN